MKTLKRYTGTCFYKNIATLEVLKELLLIDRLGLNKKTCLFLIFSNRRGIFLKNDTFLQKKCCIIQVKNVHLQRRLNQL